MMEVGFGGIFGGRKFYFKVIWCVCLCVYVCTRSVQQRFSGAFKEIVYRSLCRAIEIVFYRKLIFLPTYVFTISILKILINYLLATPVPPAVAAQSFFFFLNSNLIVNFFKKLI